MQRKYIVLLAATVLASVVMVRRSSLSVQQPVVSAGLHPPAREGEVLGGQQMGEDTPVTSAIVKASPVRTERSIRAEKAAASSSPIVDAALAAAIPDEKEEADRLQKIADEASASAAESEKSQSQFEDELQEADRIVRRLEAKLGVQKEGSDDQAPSTTPNTEQRKQVSGKQAQSAAEDFIASARDMQLSRERAAMDNRVNQLRSKFRKQCNGVLHFIHIGKTGGSSAKIQLSTALESVNLTMQSAGLRVNQHLVTLGDQPQGCYTFFLRDPVERWVSGFLSRARQGCPSHCSLQSREERVMFHNFPTPNALAEEFYSGTGTAFKANRLSIHIRESIAFYLSPPTSSTMATRRNRLRAFEANLKQILFVGSIENLDNDLDTLLKILGVPVKTKRLHIHRHSNPSQLDQLARLSNKGRCMLERKLALDYELIDQLREKGFTEQRYEKQCNYTALLETQHVERMHGHVPKQYESKKCVLFAEALRCVSCEENYKHLLRGTYYKCLKKLDKADYGKALATYSKSKLTPPPPQALQSDYEVSNQSETPTLKPTLAPKLKPLQLTHITKTGGTSIEILGRKAGYYWGQFSVPYQEGADRPYRSCSICQWQFWHIALTMLPKDLVQKYDWFMVVRNPFDRVLSEYHCKWGGRGNYIRKKFGKAGMPRTKRNLATMNKYIRMKIRRKKYVGAHYTSQHRYADDRVVMNILRFETLKPDFDNLMERYGIPLKLPLKKSNTRLVSSNPITAADFDLETVRLIQKEYAKDFRMFGYSNSRPTST